MRIPRVVCLAAAIACCGHDGVAQETEGVSRERLCRLETLSQLIVSPQELAACRELWRQSIAVARQRAQADRAQAEEMRRKFAAESLSVAPAGAQPVTVDHFLQDDLSFGDVVVTSKGPRVFVGVQGQLAEPSDFVPLDSPRSPLRGRAKQFEGASQR